MTIPLVIVLGVIAFIAVKWGKAKLSQIILGVLLGLALASTAIGPPILQGTQQLGTTIVSAVSSVVN